METEIRHRLTALEDNVRQMVGLGAALMSVVSSLPETSGLDKARIKAVAKALLQGRADAATLELKANQYVDQIVSS